MISAIHFDRVSPQRHKDTKRASWISLCLRAFVVRSSAVGRKARPTSRIIPLLVAALSFPSSNLLPAAEPPQPAPAVTPATPPPARQDLGEGLAYVRLRRLPEDAGALTAAWTAPALIVDLRYTSGGDSLPTDLPARPRTAPLFILVSPATPRAVLAALDRADPARLTLGISGAEPTPDIALEVTAETDRRAYDARDTGTPLDALISVKETKQRFDEATLNREREKNHGTSAEPAAPPDAAPVPNATPAEAQPPAAKPPEPPEPLMDRVLLRAVQLHRGLRALHRIPAG